MSLMTPNDGYQDATSANEGSYHVAFLVSRKEENKKSNYEDLEEGKGQQFSYWTIVFRGRILLLMHRVSFVLETEFIVQFDISATAHRTLIGSNVSLRDEILIGGIATTTVPLYLHFAGKQHSANSIRHGVSDALRTKMQGSTLSQLWYPGLAQNCNEQHAILTKCP